DHRSPRLGALATSAECLQQGALPCAQRRLWRTAAFPPRAPGRNAAGDWANVRPRGWMKRVGMRRAAAIVLLTFLLMPPAAPGSVSAAGAAEPAAKPKKPLVKPKAAAVPAKQ